MWNQFIADLAADDMNTFQCIARVPENLDLFGITANIYDVNANGLLLLEDVNLSDYFDYDFTIYFDDFDLESNTINFTDLNNRIVYLTKAMDVFNLVGLNLYVEHSVVTVENINDFDINIFARLVFDKSKTKH